MIVIYLFFWRGVFFELGSKVNCMHKFSLFIDRELILLWSKLQRRLDPSPVSLLERCLQLGAIAKTVDHLLYLVRVIQTEVSVNSHTIYYICF